MTKAQEIRTRRLEKLEKSMNTEAEKIFDWILDLMDADTERGYFGEFRVFLCYDQNEIKTGHDDVKYDLSQVLLKYDRVKLFTSLSKLIDKEDGFKADLNVNGTIWDEKAIILNVVME